MANTLDLMDLKQIITLSKDGLSNRGIASTLSISRNTVNHCVFCFIWTPILDLSGHFLGL